MNHILKSQEAAILLIIAASVATLMAVAAVKSYLADVPSARASQLSSPGIIDATAAATPAGAAHDGLPVFAGSWLQNWQ